MNSDVTTSLSTGQNTTPYQQVSHGHPWQIWLMTILAVLLLAAPRARVVFVAPIYFVDVIAFILLIVPLGGQMHRWAPKIPVSNIVPLFVVTVLLSEMRGMVEYGVVDEPIYIMGRYVMAASLFFTIPRLVSGPEHINMLLKAVVIGLLISALTAILYSLGPTRPLIISLVFSNDLLNPGWVRFLEIVALSGAGEAAMRGRSLAGAATLTAGFLGIAWPIAFLAYHKFKENILWKNLALAASILAPVAMLMTYGRGAWIMVGTVILLIGVLGLASARKILIMALMGGTIAATQLDIDADLFKLDRIISVTESSIDNPFADKSTSERLLSFIEPFGHLSHNPSWLVAGAGQTGTKLRQQTASEQIYDEVGLATHSAFAKSYYNFGVIAAICQVMFVILGFRFIILRVRRTPADDKDQALIWQALLMSWCSYALFWASDHAMVGEPRAVMLSFLLMGILVSFEKLRLIEIAERRRAATIQS